MNKNIQSFIDSKSIAVIGASNSNKKFGNTVYRELKAKNYRVYAVNPGLKDVEGDVCFPDLQSIPDAVEAAIVLTSPKNAERIVQDAKLKGIKRLWFQQGADFSVLKTEAEQEGIDVVSKKCILMYAPPFQGGHAIHRFIAKLFRRL